MTSRFCIFQHFVWCAKEYIYEHYQITQISKEPSRGHQNSSQPSAQGKLSWDQPT